MMQIPQAEDLATGTMNRVFSNTAATYKFYWLLSLPGMHVKERPTVMPALDVASRNYCLYINTNVKKRRWDYPL